MRNGFVAGISTAKVRAIGGWFLATDILFRAGICPLFLAVEPQLSTGALLAALIPSTIAGWVALGLCARPVFRWFHAETASPYSIVAAVHAMRRFPVRAAFLYAASWWLPITLAGMSSGGFDLPFIMLDAAAVTCPMPIAYSFAVKISTLVIPKLERSAAKLDVELRPARSSIRARMLTIGLAITLGPALFLASLAEYTRAGSPNLMPVALVGTVVFAAICASMFAADFTSAHKLLARLNRSLGQRVAERTASLAAANTRLEEEMKSRLAMEVELRQANKLEAVGRLAAGVAHEINSPVQYVTDSLTFIQSANEDLRELISAYQRLHALAVESRDPSCVAEATRVTSIENQADAHYLLGELPLAITRCSEGLTRVSKIVRSMNQFAYADGAEMVTVELNEAIANTLVICNNEIKYVADVETNFGELPPVPCYVGEINQLVLNLVVNAAHAIGDKVKGTDHRGTIAISTHAEPDAVVISIADTGGGIPAQIRDRIFDPFFTTKDVGRGTGQGLAIARAVATKHKGALEFETTEGVGTTFHLRLPLAA